jgi:hypothetical protein
LVRSELSPPRTRSERAPLSYFFGALSTRIASASA